MWNLSSNAGDTDSISKWKDEYKIPGYVRSIKDEKKIVWGERTKGIAFLNWLTQGSILLEKGKWIKENPLRIKSWTFLWGAKEFSVFEKTREARAEWEGQSKWEWTR